MQRCTSFVFKIHMDQLFLIAFTLFLFSSCGVAKPTAYFQTLNRDTTLKAFIDSNAESKIVKNDVLAITVSSLNKMEDAYYNNSSTSSSASSESSTNSSEAQGYPVDLDGNIQIHNLGKLHVEGMTRRQLKDSLEAGLLPYLKDPIVTVNFSNHRVTVLGEVIKPQVLELQHEQVSLLDVIALSGDVTADALKRDILVIRQTPKGKIFKHINLEDESVFKDSSWYNVQSGDIVYVEPNLRKLYDRDRDTRIQRNITIVLAAASLVLIILNIARYNY